MLNMMPLSRHALSLQTGLCRQFILGTIILPTLYDNINTVLIHENTEGEYLGIEHKVCNENQSLDFSHDHTPRWSMVLCSLSSSSPAKHLSTLCNMLSTMCRPRTDPESQWCTKPTSC